MWGVYENVVERGGGGIWKYIKKNLGGEEGKKGRHDHTYIKCTQKFKGNI